MPDTSQNYAPVITGGEFSASFSEPASGTPTAVVSAEGVINFTDVDIADVREASVVSRPAGAEGVTFHANVSDDANGDAPGEITWTVSVLPDYLDSLAEGETRDLVYTVELVDDFGAAVRRDVTITLTGTNDAPVITGGQTTASFAEPTSGQPTSVVSAEGVIAFKDVDIAEARDVTFRAPAGAEGVIFNASVSEEANGTAPGEILWTVSVLPSLLDSLAAGETRTLVYTVVLADDAGATVEQDVTVTLTGTNDAPVITGGQTTASFAEPVSGQPTSAVSAEGVIAFTDVDVADVREVNVVSRPIGADGVIFNAVVSEDANGDAPGEILWTVSVLPGYLDSLAEGETRDLVYTVELADNFGAAVRRDVTITLTGANDAPVVTGAVTGAATEGDLGVTLNALANASDVDDRDALTVVGVNPGQLPDGVTYDPVAKTFTLDPRHESYLILNEGQIKTVTVEYGVSDGIATTPASVSWTVTGKAGGITVGSVSDGYIANAFVFADANGNGLYDNDEASAITDSTGQFTLKHDGTGSLIVTTRPDGGVAIDLATQLPFTATLKAPEGYSVVTPITTMVNALLENGASSVQDAEAKVLAAFGITLGAGQNLANLDPLAASVDPSASAAERVNALELFKAGAKVLNTITMVVAAAAGVNPSSQTVDDVMTAVLREIITQINGNSFDLTASASLTELVFVAFDVTGKNPGGVLAGIVDVISSINTAVDDVNVDPANPNAAAILTAVTKTSVVAQSDQGAAGELAAATPETIDGVKGQFSGTNLETAIEQAEIGQVVDNPSNAAPDAQANKSVVVNEDGQVNLGIAAPTDTDTDSGLLRIVVSGLPDPAKGRVYLADGVTAVVAGQQLRADELQGLIFKTAANAEGAAGSFTYTVSDPFGGSDTQTIALAITPVPDAPTDIGVAGGVVAENAATGTVVAYLSAFDLDVGDSFNFTLLTNAGGRFSMQGNQIVVANGTLLDYEQAQSHQVVVRATDRYGLSVDKALTLSVADLFNETPIGTAGPDYLVGGAGRDRLSGGAGNDMLIGGAGHDTLDGGAGNDRLTGGAGKDVFLFKDRLNKSTNVDTITDFSVRDDTFYLDNKVFTKLEKTGNLSKSNFVVGTKAADSNDRIIYDKKKGFVYYDADGSGKGKAVLFAKVKKGLGLTEKDFRVVNERIVGDEGNNVLTGSVNKDNLSGLGGDDRLNGGGGNDALNGGVGNDTLNGGAGNDRLTGSLGNDAFVFRDRLNKSTNVDTITDFSVADDTIHLENAIFKKLKKTGDLSKAFFTVGTKAKDKNDYIVYDKKKGYLYYDADGSGQGEQVLFAKVKKGLSLTEKDFFVI